MSLGNVVLFEFILGRASFAVLCWKFILNTNLNSTKQVVRAPHLSKKAFSQPVVYRDLLSTLQSPRTRWDCLYKWYLMGWENMTEFLLFFLYNWIHGSFRMTDRLLLVLLLNFASKCDVILLPSHHHQNKLQWLHFPCLCCLSGEFCELTVIMDQSGFRAFYGFLKNVLEVSSGSLKDRTSTAISLCFPERFDFLCDT